MPLSWLSLLFWIALCFAVAGVSGRWTAKEIPGWYRDLAKPAITPPDRVFAPIWTILYVLMAIAAWRVWLAPASGARTLGLALFLVQLGLNFAWSWIFFRRHAIGAALAEVAALWIAIGATMRAFAAVNTVSVWLMAPYWAWVSFAGVLNAELWRLNPAREPGNS